MLLSAKMIPLYRSRYTHVLHRVHSLVLGHGTIDHLVDETARVRFPVDIVGNLPQYKKVIVQHLQVQPSFLEIGTTKMSL